MSSASVRSKAAGPSDSDERKQILAQLTDYAFLRQFLQASMEDHVQIP